jgi:hypothetical protein
LDLLWKKVNHAGAWDLPVMFLVCAKVPRPYRLQKSTQKNMCVQNPLRARTSEIQWSVMSQLQRLFLHYVRLGLTWFGLVWLGWTW